MGTNVVTKAQGIRQEGNKAAKGDSTFHGYSNAIWMIRKHGSQVSA